MERAWIRAKPARIVVTHGAERAVIDMGMRADGGPPDMPADAGGLRIALLAPPFLPLPPPGYAGTERIVSALAIALQERGHRVTVFGPGDSDLPCEVVPTVEHSLWKNGDPGDATGWLQLSAAKALEAADRFDVIHSHLDADGLLIGRCTSVPFVATLHGRLDTAGVSELIKALPDVPLISISDSQRRWNEDANWVATIHHGLDFSAAPVSDAPATTCCSWVA